MQEYWKEVVQYSEIFKVWFVDALHESLGQNML